MRKISKKISLVAVAIGLVTVTTFTPASAHVTVKPAEVITAGYQTFTVNVPNERGLPVTAIKVVIPAGIEGAMPTEKAGWTVAIEKEGEKIIKSITWSGSEIPDGMRGEFSFSAKVPDEETAVAWKAYQTYSDGMVVSWDKESEGGHSDGSGTSGPFSVTKVVKETDQDVAIREAKQEAQAAQASTRMALYSSITAVILGLIAIYLGTRKAK